MEIISSMNVFQRLAAVKREVGYIQKDKKVDTYMAVTHDMVTAMTRNHLNDAGVAVVPSEICGKTCETTMLTGRGTPIIRYEATFEVRFINIDKPEDQVSVRVTAHAMDQGDKAPGKAMSYATKYAVLKVLALETGEEEESRIPMTPTVNVEGHQKMVAQANDLKALEAVWKLIAADCNAASDTASYAVLKAAVNARKAELTPKPAKATKEPANG